MFWPDNVVECEACEIPRAAFAAGEVYEVAVGQEGSPQAEAAEEVPHNMEVDSDANADVDSVHSDVVSDASTQEYEDFMYVEQLIREESIDRTTSVLVSMMAASERSALDAAMRSLDQCGELKTDVGAPRTLFSVIRVGTPEAEDLNALRATVLDVADCSDAELLAILPLLKQRPVDMRSLAWHTAQKTRHVTPSAAAGRVCVRGRVD